MARTQIHLPTQVRGALPISMGGTGTQSGAPAGSGSLPDQTGHAGQVLTTNGVAATWQPLQIDGGVFDP